MFRQARFQEEAARLASLFRCLPSICLGWANRWHDGDSAIQSLIAGAVHLAHPARTNFREDFVRAEALIWQMRHSPSILEWAEYNAGERLQSGFFTECKR
jgi:hypothetical protein